MSSEQSNGRPDERNREKTNGDEPQCLSSGALQLGSRTRRSLLRVIGAGGLLSIVAAIPAAARGRGAAKGRGAAQGSGAPDNEPTGGKLALEPIPVNFAIYGGGGDDPANFGYPVGPLASGLDDPGTGDSLFDASGLEMTPSGNTLHHGFRFSPDHRIVGKPKPYTLVHEGSGRYTTRGQVVNFRLEDDVSLAPYIEYVFPAGKWRAVARETITLVQGESEMESGVWAVTRVDFYTRGGGRPNYVKSLLYLLGTPNFLGIGGDGVPIVVNQDLEDEVEKFIGAGPANHGGQ